MNRTKQWRIRLKWTVRKLWRKLLRRKQSRKRRTSPSQSPTTSETTEESRNRETREQRRWEMTLLILRILPNLLILLPKLVAQIKRVIQSWSSSGES